MPRSQTTGIRRYFIPFFSVFCSIFLIFLPGCTGGGGTDVGNPQVSLSFSSDQELKTYLTTQYAESVVPANTRNNYALDAELAANAVAGADDPPPVNADDFSSKTNVQEAGVDESDKVKTDGEYLYVAQARAVSIVKASPTDQMEELGIIDVSGVVDSIYLYNDKLVILYTPDNGDGTYWTGTDLTDIAFIGMPYWLPVQAKIGIMVVNIALPSAPSIEKDMQADGSLVSSRLIDGRMHVVLQFFPNLPPIYLDYDGTEADKTATIEENKQALDDLPLDDFLPGYTIKDGLGVEIDSGRLIETKDFLRPVDPNGGSIITILTIDLDNPDGDTQPPFNSMGFIADAHHIYASTTSLYLVSTAWDYRILSEGNASDGIHTHIYKFNLTEKATHVGTGRVIGHVLNQFSMGEYQDVLRIATTTGWTWDGTSGNHVFCLKETDEGLSIIGSINNLAPGEEIYSARFIGPRGFLVTFVNTDPLFTLDLSDPENPQVMGALKVPGYSDYIHLLGANHLLTIGKDVKLENEFPYYQGVQLSIFDISDFANPTLLYKELIGDRGTDSEALHNHKAFTFWPENNLLAFPVDLRVHAAQPVNAWAYGEHIFTGLFVYRATPENGFEYLGSIDMIDASTSSYYNDWMRGVFIGSDIYAINREMIKAAPWGDIAKPFDSLSID